MSEVRYPWGDQGVKIPEGSTVQDMLNLAGLNWGVLKEPSYTLFPNNPTPVPIRGTYNLRRSDHTFAQNVPSNITEGYEPLAPYVGKVYKPVQNDDALSVFMEYIETGNMTMDVVGQFSDGRTIWGLASLNDGFVLDNGEEIQGYLLLSQSHEYGNSMRVSFVTKHVPSQTTLVNAFNSKVQGKDIGVYRLRHSRKFTLTEKELIKETIGISKKRINQYEVNVRKMIGTKITEAQGVKFVLELFDPSALLQIHNDGDELPQTWSALTGDERVNRVAKKFLSETDCSAAGNTLASHEGTAWGLFNRVLYYFDHVNGRSVSTRLESSWFGANAKAKNRALLLALSM